MVNAKPFFVYNQCTIVNVAILIQSFHGIVLDISYDGKHYYWSKDVGAIDNSSNVSYCASFGALIYL